MIRVSLDGLFFLYLASFLAVIFLAWAAASAARLSRERRALRDFTQCSLCGLLYRPGPRLPAPCPRCGALNEHKRIHLF